MQRARALPQIAQGATMPLSECVEPEQLQAMYKHNAATQSSAVDRKYSISYNGNQWQRTCI